MKSNLEIIDTGDVFYVAHAGKKVSKTCHGILTAMVDLEDLEAIVADANAALARIVEGQRSDVVRTETPS